MNHYEIILIINPDKNNQILSMIKHYNNIISSSKGKVHRFEDWGKRQLAYPIKKIYKANYILLNIEVTKKIMKELNNIIKFNESIIRYIIINVKHAIKEISPIMKIKEDRKIKKENNKLNINNITNKK